MTSFYDTFGTDGDLECGQGVELDYGDCGVITIHRAGGANRRFQRVIAAKFKPYEHRLQGGTLDDSVADRLLAEAYAEAVIVGWRDVKGDDGRMVEFTKANAAKLLADLPELFADIREQATRVANFRRDALEAAGKNSPGGSDSTRSSGPRPKQ